MLLTGWCELQPESAAGPRCPVRGPWGWGLGAGLQTQRPGQHHQ